MFNAPVPGQSLTSPPKKYPYERPPEINDPEEALQMHLTQLSKEGMTENITDMLELDVDIVTLTEGILRNAVSKGIHSIDVSLSIAPVIHEFIKKTAEDAGIEYEEGLEDKEAIAEGQKAIDKAKSYKTLERMKAAMAEPKEEVSLEPVNEEEPEGFVRRRT